LFFLYNSNSLHCLQCRGHSLKMLLNYFTLVFVELEYLSPVTNFQTPNNDQINVVYIGTRIYIAITIRITLNLHDENKYSNYLYDSLSCFALCNLSSKFEPNVVFTKHEAVVVKSINLPIFDDVYLASTVLM